MECDNRSEGGTGTLTLALLVLALTGLGLYYLDTKSGGTVPPGAERSRLAAPGVSQKVGDYIQAGAMSAPGT